ncbi:hypothetical protein GCM10029976_032670 [Kribbella albertanoniae]
MLVGVDSLEAEAGLPLECGAGIETTVGRIDLREQGSQGLRIGGRAQYGGGRLVTAQFARTDPVSEAHLVEEQGKNQLLEVQGATMDLTQAGKAAGVRNRARCVSGVEPARPLGFARYGIPERENITIVGSWPFGT